MASLQKEKVAHAPDALHPVFHDPQWLLENFFDKTLDRKPRRDPLALELENSPAIRRVFAGVLGFGRSYPGWLINDEVLLEVQHVIDRYGEREAIAYYRRILTRPMRVIMRAILRNLSRAGYSTHG